MILLTLYGANSTIKIPANVPAPRSMLMVINLVPAKYKIRNVKIIKRYVVEKSFSIKIKILMNPAKTRGGKTPL